MTEGQPSSLSGKPSSFMHKKRRNRRTPSGYQVIHARSTVRAHSVKPPPNLIAQIARFIVGDTMSSRTDWPPHLLKIAEQYMRAAHFPGLEARGSAWVQRTRDQIRRNATP